MLRAGERIRVFANPALGTALITSSSRSIKPVSTTWSQYRFIHRNVCFSYSPRYMLEMVFDPIGRSEKDSA